MQGIFDGNNCCDMRLVQIKERIRTIGSDRVRNGISHDSVWSTDGVLVRTQFGACCDTRLGADQELSRTIGINPEIPIPRTKLIFNQLNLLFVYI